MKFTECAKNNRQEKLHISGMCGNFSVKMAVARNSLAHFKKMHFKVQIIMIFF